MMKKALLFLSFVLTILCIPSCKDQPTGTIAQDYCVENPESCEVVMEGKNYFAFPVGSWWVYEEENSGMRDSIYVTEYSNSETTYAFDVRMVSARDDYEYHYFPQYINVEACSHTIPSVNKCLYVKKSKGKPMDFLGEGNCFFINHRPEESIYVFNTVYQYNKLTCKSIDGVYTLGSLQFDRTVKFHEDNTFNEGKQETNHYYSKGVGLIRKELIDSNQVWNLVDYYIQE